MLVSERVINGMERRGYSQTKGAALLNDVVVVELRHPFPSTKTL
ncbi:Putative uncharacterized protein, partial [Moritella viscosa]